jgi:hypothetical protein
MRDAFQFKRGARLPSRTMTLKSKATFDLATASSVKLVYRKVGVVERNEIVASSIDAPNKRVTFDFGTLDTDELAQYQWHVEAVFSGKRWDFPEGGFYTFSVVETIEVP